ncbi:hypothetical protein ACV3WZ_10310 [Clostridium perfringens]|uniref:hypothetical protein n=1 Tax=Clostridium perfringens TaxID=1502 RepID=UPI001C8495CD|nr:hypothetical protein [Clostridium perfringens]MDM1004200.1 hypothetical protein [Clostridium perfringens]MDU6193429.1 hypothetical protein [Clostridium perfringens]MDZ4906339.1 hypothetical protein [Clostridium perfringens]
MIICKNCLSRCDEGSKFCTSCGNELEQSLNKEVNCEDKCVRNTNILLSEGEVNVRSYHITTFPNLAITRFFSLATDGYVSITNRRIIFFGDGKGSSMVSEVSIDKVGGLVSYSGKGWNKLSLLLWGIVYLLQAKFILSIFDSLGDDFSFSGFLSLILFIAIFALSIFVGKFYIRPWLYEFYIAGDGVQVTPVNIGNLKTHHFSRVTGQGAVNSIHSYFPGPDKERISREIGALIRDIQTLGEYGVEKWIDNKPETVFNNSNDNEKNIESDIFA